MEFLRIYEKAGGNHQASAAEYILLYTSRYEWWYDSSKVKKKHHDRRSVDLVDFLFVYRALIGMHIYALCVVFISHYPSSLLPFLFSLLHAIKDEVPLKQFKKGRKALEARLCDLLSSMLKDLFKECNKLLLYMRTRAV